MNQIHSSWNPLFEQYTFNLDALYSGFKVYPPREKVFSVFEIDVLKIRVVLLGQDPYHGENQANGLSFSVPICEKIPPSLRNIFKELRICFPERNYDFDNGNLERWLKEEGIFLLNSSLTVEERKPGSHMKLWEEFTNDVIKFISENNSTCVFLLLGKFAQSKGEFVENPKQIVSAPHPSPLSRGFIGSNCFINVEKVLGYKLNWAIQ